MSEVTISCPHCRRQYNMKIDPERLKRLKTRATCGRCGKTFDAAERIVSPSAPTNPKLERVDVAPPAAVKLVPTIKPPAASTAPATAPDLKDEMEELAREFAEAAARFTPVGVKRSDLDLPTDEPRQEDAPAMTASDTRELIAEPEAEAGDATPTLEQLSPVIAAAAPEPVVAPITPEPIDEPPPAAAPPAAALPEETPPAAAAPAPTPPTVPDEASWLDASLPDPPAATSPPAAQPVPAPSPTVAPTPSPAEDDFAAGVPTKARAAAPPAAPVAPLSWLDLADPGLGALHAPASPGVAALEQLLDESDAPAPTPSA